MSKRSPIRVVGSLAFATTVLLVACSAGQGADEHAGTVSQAESAPRAATAPSGATTGLARDTVRPLPFLRTGVRPGVYPVAPKVTPAPASNFCTTAPPNLAYYGGQLIQDPHVVNVNWSSHVAANIQSSMGQFYTDILKNPFFDWLSEYESIGVNGQDGLAGSNQAIVRGGFVKTVTLSPPGTCAGTGACTVTDAQVQSELNAQITAGNLPVPTTDCDGFVDTIYMINFPPNVTIEQPSGDCASPPCDSCTVFCGYHSSFRYGASSEIVPYAILPDLSTGPCATGCELLHSTNTYLQNATTVASHELFEATTDTDVVDATSNGRPLAWYDPNCGEIGDICAYQYGSVTVGANTWTVQQMWSNAANDCVSLGTAASVCDAPNPPAGCRKCSCADNNSALGCNGSTPWCETNAANIQYGHCVQCTDTAECPSGDTCQSTAVTTTDDTCLGTACGALTQPCCTGNVCTAPNVCTAGVCTCSPKVTCTGAQNCGTQSDGCGGTIPCGTCTSPQTCGGGGVANECGCTKKTACTGAQNCGTQSDGCGGTVSCGTCTSPQTCGGGGVVNECGCTKKTACTGGANCGSQADGCGGTVACGTCATNQTCVSNKCQNDPVDAGSDAGSGKDAGGNADGAAPADSGPGGDDSGPVTGDDSGSGSDDAAVAPDGTTGTDAALASDSAPGGGSDDGSAASDGGGGGTGSTSGCGQGRRADGGALDAFVPGVWPRRDDRRGPTSPASVRRMRVLAPPALAIVAVLASCAPPPAAMRLEMDADSEGKGHSE